MSGFQGGVEGIENEIKSASITVIGAIATFGPKSASPLTSKEVREILLNDPGSLAAGTSLSKLGSIIILDCDNEDDADVAVSLGISEFPTVMLYQNGKVIRLLSGCDLTKQSVQLALSQEADETQLKSGDDMLQHVLKSYAKTVNKEQGSCFSSNSLMAYTLEDLAVAGASDLGLGCGNPLSFAEINEGMTVLDLGSGAGIDCFIAGKKVGDSGKVIGVDMTPDMIFKARSQAKEKNFNNVQFRLGEIEYLPVANDSVDLVISNCVINLSPDKQQVCREMFRCLKPGGKIAICDVVSRPNTCMPEHLKTAESLACCVAGAPEVEGLESYLRVAGFSNVFVDIKEESRDVIKQWLPGSGAENFVVSANIHGTKMPDTSKLVSCPSLQEQEESKECCPPSRKC